MHRPLSAYIRWAALHAVFALLLFCITMVSRGRFKAWRRNSLVLGYWSENSDLDLTLFSFERGPFPAGLIRLWSIFRRSGEWAAYEIRDQEWVQFANLFELQRDPQLFKMFFASFQPTRAQAFAFWLRMYSSDAYLNSSEKRASRKGKWDYHQKSLMDAFALDVKENFPESVVAVGEALSPIPASDWPKYEHALYPHRWIAQALHSEHKLDEVFSDLSPELLEVARSQVHWEMWGLLGQVRLRQNWQDVRQHLLNLSRLFAAQDPLRSEVLSFLCYLDELEAGRT